MATRYNINDFALANPAYVVGTVSFWTVSGGAKTATLATLYAASTGSTTLANPRTLDSDGKFSVPVYVEVPTIATVSGLTIADHDTGIMGLAEEAASTSATAAAVSAAAALASQTAAAASAAAASAAITGIGQRSATTVGGTVDAITATFTPVFASLSASAGIVLAIPLAGANTSTTPSLAIDGLTEKTIVKWSGTALVAGDIPGGDFVGLLAYDASADKFQLLNPASATVSQVDAEAGTSQVVKNWTAERVAQAIAAQAKDTTVRTSFTASGNLTFPAGVTQAIVTGQAAGGGGGGSTDGADGGSLTFGPNGGAVVLTLAGGAKGRLYSGGTPGAGGAGGGSGLNQGAYGENGQDKTDIGGGTNPSSYNNALGGHGGAGMFGNLGGGGRGSDGTSLSGAAAGGGGAGEQVFRYLVTVTAGQWDVTINAAGAAGTASGAGTASSAGKGGFFIVEYLTP